MLQQIRITSFKCFKDLSLNFGKLTVLTGFNGAGKSSITQALLAVAQAKQELGPSQSGLVELDGPLIALGSLKELLHEGSGTQSFEVDLSSQSGGITCTFSPSALDQPELTARVNIRQREDPAHVFKAIKELAWIPADRVGPTDIHPIRSLARQSSVGGTGAVGLLHHKRDANIGEGDPRRSRDRDISVRIPSQVDAWMRELFPGTRISVQSIIGTDLASLSIRTSDIQSFRRPKHVGFGVSYSLPVVASLLCADASQTLLIDSPEVHLHPQVQSLVGMLCALAAAAGVQVIVETHSEHILNAIRIAVKDRILTPTDVSLNFLGPAAGEHRVVGLSEAGSIAEWPAGFFDEAFLQLDRLMGG